jgi:hypothetical protein
MARSGVTVVARRGAASFDDFGIFPGGLRAVREDPSVRPPARSALARSDGPEVPAKTADQPTARAQTLP